MITVDLDRKPVREPGKRYCDLRQGQSQDQNQSPQAQPAHPRILAILEAAGVLKK